MTTAPLNSLCLNLVTDKAALLESICATILNQGDGVYAATTLSRLFSIEVRNECQDTFYVHDEQNDEALLLCSQELIQFLSRQKLPEGAGDFVNNYTDYALLTRGPILVLQHVHFRNHLSGADAFNLGE